jgi:hypothetical protein
MKNFKVKQTNDGRFQITGTSGYRLVVDNRYDAIKHCQFLNNRERLVEQNQEYYTTLKKIEMLTSQIKKGTGEIHILELAIRIQRLLQEVL